MVITEFGCGIEHLPLPSDWLHHPCAQSGRYTLPNRPDPEMKIDPECPTEPRSAIVTALQILSGLYLVASLLAAGFIYLTGRENMAQAAALKTEMAASGMDLGATLSKTLETIGWVWNSTAVALLLQGVVVTAVLLALGAIVEHLTAIRISSRIVAQSAHDARTRTVPV